MITKVTLTFSEGLGIDSEAASSEEVALAFGAAYKGDRGPIVKPVATALPSSGGLLPNIFYNLTSALTGSVTITLAAAETTADEYELAFDTGSTVPTITWPSGLCWSLDDSASVVSPTIEANKHYEVNIRNGYALFSVFNIHS